MTSKMISALKIGLVAAMMIAIVTGSSFAGDSNSDHEIERIGPQETRELVTSGQALLVCSYSDTRCQSILLEGALLRSELDEKIQDLSMTQQLIFYCG